jgi:hypothetical protein
VQAAVRVRSSSRFLVLSFDPIRASAVTANAHAARAPDALGHAARGGRARGTADTSTATGGTATVHNACPVQPLTQHLPSFTCCYTTARTRSGRP